MEPLDDLPELGSFNEEDTEPLGLANPLLPPEPLGQNLLYPQFLVPVAAEPLMATNPSMFFPEGIPGYQPPENLFQELPFFAEARTSLRMGQAVILPETLQGSRRVPRPILSDLLGDLEFQTDFEAPAESPELTTNEIEITEVPTLEDFEVIEEGKIQPVPPEEVGEAELPTIPEIETQELVETLPKTELSPESSSNPLSVPAVSEENFVADTSSAEPIAAELALQETELTEATVAFSSISEELGSPVIPQSEESPEETEPAVVPELPELIGQPSDVEVTVTPEVELSEETEIPEPITANSPPPELAEILTESAAESIAPEPEPLPVTPTTASTIVSDLERTVPEPGEVPESSELIEVQREPEVEEALEPTAPEAENIELIEVEAAVSPESELPEEGSLLPVAESTAEENESLPELTNEAPVISTEAVTAVAAEIVEPPISNPEIIAAEIEETTGEELIESTPFPAEAELTSPAEPETPPSMAVSAEIEPIEELENTEQLPISEESIAVPVEVIPEGEPLTAEQNQSEEEAISAEPLAVTPQEMAIPETEQNPENQPESESNPPISRIQELIEQQIEAFSGLEQEEVIEEEKSTAPESAVPTVMEEGTQPLAVEENIPLEIPPEVATTEMAAPALEIPIVAETESESAPLQSNSDLEFSATQTETQVLPLPTILENLGILIPLSTFSPLTQLANFLPVAELFASQQRERIPLGLEQPMTFASPPSTSSVSSLLTQLANFLPVAEPFVSEQREGIPLGLEQPMTFASITPPSLESSSPTTPNFPAPNEESDLSETSSSTSDSSTETESAMSQEETPSFSETMSSLPIVPTLPVMQNEGIFTPLTFAQRSINDTQTNDQEGGSSPSLSTLNIPQEWSSIEDFINSNPSIERDEFNSLFSPEISSIGNESEGGGYTPEISDFMSSRSLENSEDQNFISESASLDNMDEELLNLQGENDEDNSMDERNEDKEDEIDLEVLAKEIYGLLQQRLVIERERRGYYSGRLPW